MGDSATYIAKKLLTLPKKDSIKTPKAKRKKGK